MRASLLFLVLMTAGLAGAQMLPEYIGEFAKGAPKALAVPDQALYAEYGVEATEQAEYTLAAEDSKDGKAPKKKPAAKHFSATVWRLKDPTSALALFQLRRPPGATRAKMTPLAVQTSDGVIFALGNYLLQITGSVPDNRSLSILYSKLPKLEQSPLPAVTGFLPQEGLIPNSERYVMGPVSLERFEPRISPSLAAFHLGAEAQLGKYKTAKGEITLAIFNYPTPSMARERQEALQGVAGAMVKRSGPLVAVIVQPADTDAAERLLAKVRYQANLTESEKIVQPLNKGLSNMMMSIFALAGFLIALSIILGIGLGGFRILLRKLGRREDSDAMTVLRIRD